MKDYSKFKPYKTAFTVFFITAFAAYIFGMVAYSKSTVLRAVCDTVFGMRAIENSLVCRILPELLSVTLLFAMGPTIYAPASSFLLSFVYGALLGTCAASLGRSTYLFIAEIIISALTIYFMTVYASLTALTGLQLFSDDADKKEDTMFTGVLFKTQRFRGIFNFRFITVYVAVYILFLFFIAAATLLRTVFPL